MSLANTLEMAKSAVRATGKTECKTCGINPDELSKMVSKAIRLARFQELNRIPVLFEKELMVEFIERRLKELK
jgi:hypothetical protein